MRERINRLAKGIIDSEFPEVKISPPEIDETVGTGGILRREFVVTSENHIHIKGLVYSSNFRIKPVKAAFGGAYNHLSYEINAEYLEDGDEISGTFYLVTNGGEMEVPYVFRVELGTSQKALSDLKTAKDFAQVAGKDMDIALRLFEYRDFGEAPFMKDLFARTVYDGLKGRLDRKREMEEFLIALNVREPLNLQIDTKERRYAELRGVLEDEIRIERGSFGYVNLEISTDCDFIELPKKRINEPDFEGIMCKVPFFVHQSHMHRGNNYGRIFISGSRESFVIPVTGFNRQGGGMPAETAFEKEALLRFLRLRLEAETGEGDLPKLCEEMENALSEIELIKGEESFLKLFRIELCIFRREFAKAVLYLDECRDRILQERQNKKELYCFYQYLRLGIEPDEDQKESLLRLMKKYLEEDRRRFWLYLLMIKLDHRVFRKSTVLFSTLNRYYDAGVRSPFFYVWVCKAFNMAPDLMEELGPMELQVLLHCAGRGLIEQELALAISALSLAEKRFNPLYYRMLTKLYGEHPEKEVLEAICSYLIKGECRTADAFFWYEKGVGEKISLTRLYEYYLYSLPKDFSGMLPKEVLLYFSYEGSQLDISSRTILYENVLRFLEPTDPLFNEYERTIEKYATERLFESEVDLRLAVIYERMILREVIDLPMAKVFPSILRSYWVKCENDKMKYVIVCYEETVDEQVFPLDGGVAYVPLFSERSILLFQDAYGNRYAGISYEKRPVMERPDLERRCFELYPSHPMLWLKACGEILKNGVRNKKEARILEEALESPVLRPLYRRQIFSKVIEFYQMQADREGEGGQGAAYLLALNKHTLSKSERIRVCRTLIHYGYMEEAYQMVKEFGCEEIGADLLSQLCGRMILQTMFQEDGLLLYLAYEAFQRGKCDSVLLDYLCEHFNGLTEQMYRVLVKSAAEHVETYDMEERLTAQMMFSGAQEHLDKVFSLYLNRREISDNIVKAYLALQCTKYLMEEKDLTENMFTCLEEMVSAVHAKNRFPVIFLMALCKYYAYMPSLDRGRLSLCAEIVDILLERGYVFPYFKLLALYIPMPEEVTDRAMLQYCGRPDVRVELEVRILPDEEEFHSEDIVRVYHGVYVKQKILFDGEIMEYKVREIENGVWTVKKEGSLSCAPPVLSKDLDNRYAYLNEMGLCHSIKDETGLKKRMQEYLETSAIAEKLFPLM